MRSFPITWQNAVRSVGEINTLPSLTIPDQVLTMDELVRRYVRGDPNVTQFQPVYSDNDDLPNIETMDEMEKLEMARALKDRNISDLAVMKANEAARRRQKEIDKAIVEEKANFSVMDDPLLPPPG